MIWGLFYFIPPQFIKLIVDLLFDLFWFLLASSKFTGKLLAC